MLLLGVPQSDVCSAAAPQPLGQTDGSSGGSRPRLSSDAALLTFNFIRVNRQLSLPGGLSQDSGAALKFRGEHHRQYGGDEVRSIC